MLEPSTLFRIQAHTYCLSMEENWLSYNVGKVYYVMGINEKESCYFVTDDKKLPFSKGSTSGFVYINYFWIFEEI